MFEDVGDFASDGVPEPISGGDARRRFGRLLALAFEFLDVSLMNRIPEEPRLIAPGIWRDAG